VKKVWALLELQTLKNVDGSQSLAHCMASFGSVRQASIPAIV
jgi:hypothetical protein